MGLLQQGGRTHQIHGHEIARRNTHYRLPHGGRTSGTKKTRSDVRSGFFTSLSRRPPRTGQKRYDGYRPVARQVFPDSGSHRTHSGGKQPMTTGRQNFLPALVAEPNRIAHAPFRTGDRRKRIDRDTVRSPMRIPAPGTLTARYARIRKRFHPDTRHTTRPTPTHPPAAYKPSDSKPPHAARPVLRYIPPFSSSPPCSRCAGRRPARHERYAARPPMPLLRTKRFRRSGI